MIKELLLSLAVAAFSGVSSFVGSPKRASNNLPDLRFTCFLYASSKKISGEETYDTTQQSFSFGLGGEDKLTFNGWGSFTVYFDGEDNGFNDSSLYIGFYGIQYKPNVEVDENYWSVSYLYEDHSWVVELKTTGQAAYEFLTEPNEDFDLKANITFTEGVEPKYTITKNLYNCSINSIPELPNTYQTGSVDQTFVIYGAANSDIAGDYGFTSSSLSVSGASSTALSLNNEIGNSGYFRACSFSVTLPANSFTITLRAYRPEFSIVSKLNNCTVSPAIKSSYSGMFAEDFTFTAEQGFYFNKNVTQWEFTGGVVAQEPEYIGLVWGTLYESVKIRFVFDAGNATIRVSGVAYTIDSYQQGWRDGDKSGYDRGHADGLIAGDSYGVWNWLKQAARTTGEFFNIPLLPGFSIGALLTALAGLAIIWLFIKGFLFKS